MRKKFLSYLPHILALLFVVGFAVFAWTEPSQAPPGGNVPAPVNVGSVEQIKSGNLTVNALGVSASGNALLVPNGNVGIGTASSSAKLQIDTNNLSLDRALKVSYLGNVVLRIFGTGAIEQYKAGAVKNFFDPQGDSYITGGNLGVGTNNPQAKLDVNGNIKITDGTQGADKVLTSDASGLASWSDPIPPGSLMGEWWVSGNPVCRCYSDSNCFLPIGYKDGVGMINVNNNSVVSQNCPYALTVCDSGTCQPTAPDTTFLKCADGLTEKSMNLGVISGIQMIKKICTK